VGVELPKSQAPRRSRRIPHAGRSPFRKMRQHSLPSGAGPESIALLVTADHPSGALHAATACMDWEASHGDTREACQPTLP